MDNASSDRTLDIVRNYQRSVTGLSEARRGAAAARNAGLPAERLAALAELSGAAGGGVPGRVAVVRTRYLPVRVPYGEEDARAAREALACHRSQYTPEEAATMDGMARTLENGTVHLRPWFVETEVTDDIFE